MALKKLRMDELIVKDEKGCWTLATMEQADLWNWFVIQPEVQDLSQKNITKKIGNVMMNLPRLRGSPYNSVVHAINNDTGKRYDIAPRVHIFALSGSIKVGKCDPCKDPCNTCINCVNCNK
jgi:hypothetical protein